MRSRSSSLPQVWWWCFFIYFSVNHDELFSIFHYVPPLCALSHAPANKQSYFFLVFFSGPYFFLTRNTGRCLRLNIQKLMELFNTKLPLKDENARHLFLSAEWKMGFKSYMRCIWVLLWFFLYVLFL